MSIERSGRKISKYGRFIGEYGTTERVAETWYLSLRENLNSICNKTLGPDTKVLEIGTGNGTLLEYLRMRGVDAVGIDASPGETTPGLAVADAELLPFADNTFDAVVSVMAFDNDIYTQDQGAMLREIARVLKPGGIYEAQEAFMQAAMPELHQVENTVGPVFQKSDATKENPQNP